MRSDSIKKAKDGVSGGVFYLGLAVIGVLAIPSDTVRKIQMEARSGTLTLAYADGSWSLAEDPDYHLDESSCNAMLTAVSALNAKRELQEAAGEDYGFRRPP